VLIVNAILMGRDQETMQSLRHNTKQLYLEKITIYCV